MGYDAAGRLLTTDRGTVNDRTNWQNDLFHRRTQAAINTGYGSFEEYRYDPLGRRIWKRTHRDSYCTDEARAQAIYEAECASAVTVTLWDGDQVLYEIRAAAADSLSSSQLEHNIDSPIGSGTPFGSFSGLTYLHGIGIDRPLELIRAGEVLVFHTSWRGAIDASTNTAGQFSTCGLALDVSCVNVKWPGQEMGLTYIRPYAAREAAPWYGDLSQGQLDASGKMYMRNRYYDPVTGRFTQEDPIGLAGGTNLYGFGGGDPVNFSDPFGLCTIGKDCWHAFVEAAKSFWNEPSTKTSFLAAAMLFENEATDPTGAGLDVEMQEAVTAPRLAKIQAAYKRPSGATTPAQRAAVQGNPCVKCGVTAGRMVAGHKKALVVEHYETGTIDRAQMRSVEAVQSECPTCSAREGGLMAQFSRRMKQVFGFE